MAFVWVALAGTVVHVARTPVIVDPEQRSAEILSVPAAIEFLTRESAGTSDGRLLAPLPCDMPARYHMVRLGLSTPINGTPEQGETIWLLAPCGKDPEWTLANQVVKLADWSERLKPWRKVEDFSTLSLWVSSGALD